jgi:hypothetical protein
MPGSVAARLPSHGVAPPFLARSLLRADISPRDIADRFFQRQPRHITLSIKYVRPLCIFSFLCIFEHQLVVTDNCSSEVTFASSAWGFTWFVADRSTIHGALLRLVFRGPDSHVGLHSVN